MHGSEAKPPPLRWAQSCRKPFTSTNIYPSKSSLLALNLHTWSRDAAKVCPKSPNGSQLGPKSASRPPFGAPLGSLTSENTQKHIGISQFPQCQQIVTLSLMAALLAPRGLKLEPQGAPKEHKGSQRLPFGAHVSLLFRPFVFLRSRWGPEGCPGALQSPKWSKSESPGSKKRSQSAPQCSKHNTQLCSPSAKQIQKQSMSTELPKPKMLARRWRKT